MKKPLKIILGILGALVLLVVVGVLLITLLVDPNDYKPELAALVEKATGHQVEFNGPLELKVFPSLAVGAKKVLVKSDPSFGEAPLLDLDEASLSMALFPLLSGRLEVGSVLLSGARVNLVTDAKGRNNWDMPAKTDAGAKPAGQADAKPDAAAESKSKVSAEIASVKIEKFALNYKNRQSGQDVSLTVNELELKNIGPDREMDILLDVVMNDKASATTASAKLQGKASFAPESQDLGLNLSTVSLTAKNAAVKEPQTLSGHLKAQFGLKTMSGNVDLQLDNPNLGLKLGAKSSGTASAGKLPPMNGNLKLTSNPAKLLAVLGMQLETADSKALGSFNLESPLTVMDKSGLEISLPTIKGNLDSTELSGNLVVILPSGQSGLTLASNLIFGDINLDNYLPPASSGAASGQKSAAPAAASAGDKAAAPQKAILKDTALEKGQVSLNLKVNSATIKKIPLRNIAAELGVRNGVASLSAFSLETLGGTVEADGNANLLQVKPPVTANLNVQAIDIETALKSLAGTNLLAGTANFNTSLRFNGLDRDSIFNSLAGNGHFNVDNGKIQNFQLIPADAPEILRKYRAQDYPFEKLGGSFTASGGVIKNSDLAVKSAKFSASGAGMVDLGKNNIDYQASLQLPDITVPIKLSGSLDNVKYGLDVEAAVQEAAKDAGKKAIEDLQEKGKIPKVKDEDAQKIKEGVGNLLDKLKK